MKPKSRATPPAPRLTDVEVEVKLPCDDIARLDEGDLDLEPVEPRHFEDNWVFQLPDGKLRKGQYLRVRYTGNGDGAGRRREGLLTYKGKSRRTDGSKGKNKGKKVREEIETTVGQPPKVVKILKRLGLRRSFRYQKYRTVYRVAVDGARSLLLMYDETPIGNFIELEGEGGAIEQVASKLGYPPETFIIESYVEMQLARCKSRNEPLGDMVFAEFKRAKKKAKKRPASEAKAAPKTPPVSKKRTAAPAPKSKGTPAPEVKATPAPKKKAAKAGETGAKDGAARPKSPTSPRAAAAKA